MKRTVRASFLILLVLARCQTPLGGQTSGTNDKLIGPVVFHWFNATEGQFQTVWLPLEGRRAWDGSVRFWRRQEKDIMAAGFNMILFEVPFSWEQEQRNHLTAIRERRNESLPVPRIAPFFAAESFESYSERKDISTAEGKDAFYRKIRDWFLLYRDVFRLEPGGRIDPSQLAFVNGKVLISLWWVPLKDDYVPSGFFDSLNDRLYADFGFRGYWSVHDYFRRGGADEYNALFNGAAPVKIGTNRSASLLVGFWPPGPDYPPGTFLARDSGRSYSEAWDRLIAMRGSIDRIYVESWNEYSEGSGMYAAQPMSHSPTDGHWAGVSDARCWSEPCHPVPETDSWGAAGPWTYIDLTREKVDRFLRGGSAGDLVPPHIVIAQPGDGQTVSGNIRFKTYASDDVGLKRLEFFLDGALVDVSPIPFDYLLKTLFLADGVHELRVAAYDLSGNSDSDSVAVLVDNGRH
jgi:hypothetical protein